MKKRWSYGSFLEFMDVQYHRGHLPLIGWVFCDLKDMYYGMSVKQLAREHYRRLRRRIK